MKILIDMKNPALFKGGISKWFIPLLAAWMKNNSNDYFYLVGPEFDKQNFSSINNWTHVNINIYNRYLPKILFHPWYDNVTFPNMTRKINPDLVMSPYHDVRMLRRYNNIITIHDLCFNELIESYPSYIRYYFLLMLKINISVSKKILTVSQYTKNRIMSEYKISGQKVDVIYNGVSNEFSKSEIYIVDFNSKYGSYIFYPGGFGHRKNIYRLLEAFSNLHDKYSELILLITGEKTQEWDVEINKHKNINRSRIIFTGYLSESDLYEVYRKSRLVIYPSLCEGFGRVCLEAMVSNAWLVCSDLPVMHEVAGNYAVYFNQYSTKSIVEKVEYALHHGKKEKPNIGDFSAVKIEKNFLNVLNNVW